MPIAFVLRQIIANALDPNMNMRPAQQKQSPLLRRLYGQTPFVFRKGLRDGLFDKLSMRHLG